MIAALLLIASAEATQNPQSGSALMDLEVHLDSLQGELRAGHYAGVVHSGQTLLPRITDATVTSGVHGGILNILVEARIRSGDLAGETAALASQALGFLDHVSSEPALIATALENSAQIMLAEGNLSQARSLLERTLEIRARTPRDYAGQARTRRRLGALEFTAGDHTKARFQLDRASTLWEIGSRADPYEHIQALGLRSELACEMRHLTLGRELADRTAQIAKAHFGTSHPVHARALGWVGRAHHLIGALDLAASLYASALQTCEANGGLDNLVAAELQRDAAWLHRDIGDQSEARRLLETALDTFTRHTGSDGLETIRTGGDLGVLLWELGDPAGAVPWLEKRLGASGLDGYVRQRIRVACALASIRSELGDFTAAQELFSRTVAFAEARAGIPNETLAHVYSEYATRYFLELQDYPRAISFLEKALTLLEPTSRTLESATAMSRLAEVLCLVGDAERALVLCEKALFMRQHTFGREHPATASSLDLLARIHLKRGNPTRAFRLALQAEAAARAHFQSVAAELSEREALRYQTLRDSGIDAALTALASIAMGSSSSAGSYADMVRASWDQLLRSRHLVLDEMASRVALAQDKDEDLLRLRREVRAASQRLADLVVQRGGDESAQDALQQAQEALDLAGRRFAARNAALRQSTTAIGIGEVEAALPTGAALISYSRYNRIAFGTSAQHEALMFETPHYGAFVLTARGSPAWFDLGTAAVIDSAVEAWRSIVARAPRGSRQQRLRDEQRTALAGSTLRQLIWDPLAAGVANASQIFLVPDGRLHLVNVVTLPAGDGRYLVEAAPTLHVLSHEKDLVPHHDSEVGHAGLLVLGGSDYDRPAAPDDALLEVAGTEVELSDIRGSGAHTRQASCVDFEALRFEALPATRSEADEITNLWRSHSRTTSIGDALKLVGPLANEHAVKSLAGRRRVVHLATHGFYLGGCISDLDRARRVVRFNQGLQSLAVENPLLLCGLALSGANVRDMSFEERSSREDGILTAEEVAGLNLRGVEWAVLSACESGLGALQTGEGVVGLRRAFEIAGARTLVLSLWAVDDKSTLEWMRRLYEQRLGGMSSAQSVREASLQTLTARRQAGRSTHPFYWGAFVATGDWR